MENKNKQTVHDDESQLSSQQIKLGKEYAENNLQVQSDLTREIAKTRVSVEQLIKLAPAEAVWRDVLDKLIARFDVFEKNITVVEGQDRRIVELLTAMQDVCEKVTAMEPKLVEQLESMRRVAESVNFKLSEFKGFFEKPVAKEVKISYFLGKPFWILLGMGILVCLSTGLAIFEMAQLGMGARHDMEWRALRVELSPSLQSLLDSVDAKYSANPDAFNKEVIEKEKRIHDLGMRVTTQNGMQKQSVSSNSRQ